MPIVVVLAACLCCSKHNRPQALKLVCMLGPGLLSKAALTDPSTPVHDACVVSGLQVASGQCWVLADNEEMRPPDVIDSRTFGPLPMENILGRIIYQSQSAVEHGRVQNSEDAAEEDAAVLAAELDVETFVSGPEGSSRD